jgi:hypothetical protein
MNNLIERLALGLAVLALALAGYWIYQGHH